MLIEGFLQSADTPKRLRHSIAIVFDNSNFDFHAVFMYSVHQALQLHFGQIAKVSFVAVNIEESAQREYSKV